MDYLDYRAICLFSLSFCSSSDPHKLVVAGQITCHIFAEILYRFGLWISQIPSVTNAIEISDMRKGTGGWVMKATGK